MLMRIGAKALLGSDLYHITAKFVIYSILGWFVESVYMSICNRRLTNRGFSYGPFCPIYGFGVIGGNMLLSPLRAFPFAVYIVGAVIGTLFELCVAKLLLALFGRCYWDYTKKPFNYKGILCLESTLAWGLYAILVVYFVNGWVEKLVDRIPQPLGNYVVTAIMALAVVDYIFSFLRAYNVEVPTPRQWVDRIKDRWQS